MHIMCVCLCECDCACVNCSTITVFVLHWLRFSVQEISHCDILRKQNPVIGRHGWLWLKGFDYKCLHMGGSIEAIGHTFCSCVSSLLHSSFFCSIAISRDLSLESFFRPEEAKDEACSFRSIKLDWEETRMPNTQSAFQRLAVLHRKNKTFLECEGGREGGRETVDRMTEGDAGRGKAGGVQEEKEEGTESHRELWKYFLAC